MLGNLMCPKIIQTIGLGLGLTVWDLTNMLTGWVTGYLGLLGLPKDVVKDPGMNLLGVSLASVSLVFFSLASAFDASGSSSSDLHEKSRQPAQGPEDEDVDLEEQRRRSKQTNEKATPSRKGRTLQALSGLLMALIAGCLFGTTFDLPMELLHGDFGPHHSKQILNYVSSHFIGISLTAWLALMIYVMVKGRQSYIPCKCIVPAILSGALWGIAQVAWFRANIELGFSVAFPIIGSLPGILGLVIGVVCFRELQGCHSRIFALLGLLLRVPGVALIALSH